MSHQKQKIIKRVFLWKLGLMLHFFVLIGISVINAQSVNAAGPLTIDTETLQDVTVQTPYTRAIMASGGVAPLTWTIVNYVPSPSLMLDSSTGVISGTFGRRGSVFFEIMVTDSNGTTAVKEISLTARTLPGAGFQIINGEMPRGKEDYSYSQIPNIGGGVEPYTFSIESGTLPVGLSLNVSTGEISGIPEIKGISNFRIRLTDANGAINNGLPLVLTIDPSIFISEGFHNGTLGTAYSEFLEASGGVAPLNWSIVSGSLPPGISLNSITGEFFGVPTAVGEYAFAIRVVDSVGHTNTENQTMPIVPKIVIATESVSEATMEANYLQTLQRSGGSPDFTWSISAGSFPSGLSLDSASGVIAGIPTATGNFKFTVKVTDRWGAADKQKLNIRVNKTLIIKRDTLPNKRIGRSYSETVTVNGGTAPLNWSIVHGSLPAGLSLNPLTGLISGVPTYADTENFTVQVVDANGAKVSKEYIVQILP